MSRILYIVLLAGVLGCYYDNEESLYPVVVQVLPCDTSTVTYSLHVAPIIAAECNSCHSIAAAPASGGNIILEDYYNLQKVAASGKLVGAVSQSSGFSAMPKGKNKLSYCDRTYIRRWVEANSPNN